MEKCGGVIKIYLHISIYKKDGLGGPGYDDDELALVVQDDGPMELLKLRMIDWLLEYYSTLIYHTPLGCLFE